MTTQAQSTVGFIVRSATRACQPASSSYAPACWFARGSFRNVLASKGKISMKTRLAFTAVVSIGSFFLLLSGIRCAQAAEIKIVSPSAYEDIEGEGSVGEDCCSRFRRQQVFPAADFAALGNQPHWLVGYTFRPDQSLTSPRTVHFPDNEIRLSTTQRGPLNLSAQFNDNVGADVMQFYRGPETLMADAQGPGPGPREFYNTEFPAGVTPFLYDPSQGNLLFDLIAREGVSPSPLGDIIPGMQSSLSGPPLGLNGVPGAALIFQFTFVPVPEPSTALVVFVGSLALAARCRPTHVRLRR
jgi:hypothetical protein